MKKYHIVYRTHNLINGKEYTGKHSTDDLEDGYYGSGVGILNAVAKYGLENFAVEILSFHDSEEAALAEEARIVNEDYVNREDTYNQTLGGSYSAYHTKNMVTVVDKEGNTKTLNKSSNEYGIDWVPLSKNKVIAIDNTGNTKRVSKNEFDNSDIVGVTKGRVSMINKDGYSMFVYCDDERIKNGDLLHHSKGFLPVVDKHGNTFSVKLTNPRYLSGELVAQSAGRTYRQRQMTCPYCGKCGGASMIKRWHFSNCKVKYLL